MAKKNTPLINELLHQVSQHPDFDNWHCKGKIPAGTIDFLPRREKGKPIEFSLPYSVNVA